MSGILYDKKCEVKMSYSTEYSGFYKMGIPFKGYILHEICLLENIIR